MAGVPGLLTTNTGRGLSGIARRPGKEGHCKGKRL